jgi:hypothetical protein
VAEPSHEAVKKATSNERTVIVQTSFDAAGQAVEEAMTSCGKV